MSNRKAHELLSELHKLMAIYDPADIQKAADISPTWSDLLKILIKHAPNEPEAVESRAERYDRGANERSLKFASESRDSNVATILLYLQHSPFSSSVRSLEAFGARNGVRLKARPKEGKERFAKRLAQAITQKSKSERDSIMAELSKNSTTQTSGWVEILKSR